jgi:RHS repeat-associated protein
MNKFLKIVSVITLLVFLRTGFALSADQVFFYYTDPAGTPLVMSDSTGSVVWRADYMPFGEESIGTQTAQNNKMFVGKEKDSESGLYYFGARYMDAGAGRFASPDSIEAVDPVTGKVNEKNLLDPQRLNKYTYALNNPYRYIDPDGNQTVPARVLALIAQGNLAEAAAIAEVAGLGIAPRIQQTISALNTLTQRYSRTSLQCDKLAQETSALFKSLNANPQIINITDKAGAQFFIDNEGVTFAKTGFHQAVRVGNMVYDALTGPAGMEYAQYINKLESYGIYPVVKTIE